MLLMIGATGMFGGRTVDVLLEQGVPFRAMVRDKAKANALADRGVTLVQGDLDDPISLSGALDRIDRVFLLAPMDARKGRRERNLIAAARAIGDIHVVLLTGGVRHDDALGRDSATAEDALKVSGLPWTFVGPQTVMESNLFPQADAVKSMDGLFGCAGDGQIGMVALDDVARGIATVLAGGGEAGREYIFTGPRTVTFAGIAEVLSSELGRPIAYNDMPDADFRQLMIDTGAFTDETVDVGVMVHFEAFKAGRATLVTDDYHTLTGEQPTSIEEWVHAHRATFGG